MRRSLLFATASLMLSAASARAQVGPPLPAAPVEQQYYTANPQFVPGPQPMVPVGTPGIEYANTVAAGEGAQLYPFDQQDPWLHGHFQRYPAYGGFASFRPYNYRHVFAQAQLAPRLGASHGMPYSQQFWNRYRAPYLNGHLHALPPAPVTHPYPVPALPPQEMPVLPGQAGSTILTPTGLTRPIPHGIPNSPSQSSTQEDSRPIHVFPGQ